MLESLWSLLHSAGAKAMLLMGTPVSGTHFLQGWSVLPHSQQQQQQGPDTGTPTGLQTCPKHISQQQGLDLQ